MIGWRASLILLLACILLSCTTPARAQQTNPVERQVTNPVTDTPNVNPLQQDQPVRPRQPVTQQPGTPAPTESVEIDADKQTGSGPEGARVVVYEGNVDARIGIYRLQS